MTVTTITQYGPDGTPTAGNSLVGVVEAIADINAPTLAELDAGMAFECALDVFGITKEVSWQSRKKLCDRISTQRPGQMQYGFSSDLRVTMEDPQADQPLLAKFVEGATVYLFHRPGMDHDTPLASAQKVQVVKGIVGSVTIGEINTDEGQEYEAVVSLGVQDMNDGLLVAIA